ncbi:N-acetylmuramoyl-L-alanine amidase [Brevibacterium casei]
MYLTALATIARRTGYPVVERPGWKSRGRGPMAGVKSVICHHTAGGPKGNYPSLGVVQNGRPGLPGPLAHYGLGRDGTIYVIAAGRASHAGVVDTTSHSNSYAIGIEAENTGRGEKWSAKQMDAYAKLCRELCDHYKIPISQVRGHKEVARPRGRKPDPSFNMDNFRKMVKARKGKGSSGGSSGGGGGSPSYTKIRYGQAVRLYTQGDPVKDVQRVVGVEADGYAGPATVAAIKRWQKSHGLKDDGVVGPDTWKAMKPFIANAKKKPRKSQSAPKFPLPRGHWFGPESSNKKNHSGYRAGDRPGIRQFQKKLKDRGWSISVDGKFGPATSKVVKAFQKEKGLKADGLVGATTWAKIWSAAVT